MPWDPNVHITRREFVAGVQRIASATMRQEGEGHFAKFLNAGRHKPHWWTEGRIYVAWESSIPKATAELIAKAVDERIHELWGLCFKFTLFGSHESFTEQLDATTTNGCVDHEQLFSLAASERWRDPKRGGRQHGDIYITTRSFLNDPGCWGASWFGSGAMFFALTGQRHQHTDFLHRVTLHETTHLCGMHTHCETYQNVDGYTYNGYCNMDSAMPTPDLCPKCREYLRIFWEKIQDEYAMWCNDQTMEIVTD